MLGPYYFYGPFNPITIVCLAVSPSSNSVVHRLDNNTIFSTGSVKFNNTCNSMYRFRTSSGSAKLNLPHIKKKALNSWTAVQDTYFSTKDTFERHKVVFTVSTSVASVATAWLGYTLRHMHEKKVEQRLNSIENAMKSNFDMEHSEFKKLVGTSSSTTAAYIATAGTSLILGYGLGWRGGRWFANRKFRREQMKLLGQIKPRRWPLKFLRRPSLRSKADSSVKTSEAKPNDAPNTHVPTKPHPIC